MNKFRVLQIALQQRQKICVYKPEVNRSVEAFTVDDFRKIGTMINEAAELGFAFSNNALKSMICDTDFDTLHKTVIDTLRKMVGSHVNHNPMYKNFPMSVLEKDNEELLMDQLIGYLSDIVDYVFSDDDQPTLRDLIEFDGPIKERMPLNADIELKVIDVMSVNNFYKIFTDMMSRPAALNDSEKTLLKEFLTTMEGAQKAIPDVIPFKETMILIVDTVTADSAVDVLPLHNATDVLRYAVYRSGHEMDEMKKGVKFGKITRRQKRLILNTLESFDDIFEDVTRYKETFKKLVYQCDLFTDRYKGKYPKLKAVMNAVYDHEKLPTFNSMVAEAFEKKDFAAAIGLLKNREGEFFRKLMQLVRLAYNDKDHKDEYMVRIGDWITRCGQKASTKLLWDIVGYFDGRLKHEHRISFIAKSNTMIDLGVHDDGIDDETLQYLRAKVFYAIADQYRLRTKMGYVCMDKDMKNYMLNLNAKGTNSNSEVLCRGTRYPYKRGDVVRPFIYWKEAVDVDLSVVLLSDTFEYLDHCSYTSLRSKRKCMVHSGDIINGRNGASEFIDIYMDAVKRTYPNARYATINIFSYSGIPYKDMKECFVGVMTRDDSESGKIFEPSTVAVKFDLTTQRTSCIAAIVDLKKHELVIADMPSGANTAGSNVERTKDSASLIAYYIMNYHKPTIDDVITLNVITRGGTFVHKEKVIIKHFVDNKIIETVEERYMSDDGHMVDEKDILFIGNDPTKGLTPKDNDKIIAEYL